MTTTGKILTAFAVGAAAGAILAILFSPGKGSETRSRISEQGKKFAEKLNKAKEHCNDLKEEMKKAAKEPVNNFEEA
jgi:gas vesicle protein